MYVVSDQARAEYPVLVVVRHEKGVLSWQLPMMVQVISMTGICIIVYLIFIFIGWS